MSLHFDHPSLRLEVLPGIFFIAKQEAGQDVPVKDLMADSGKFISITRTTEEISIVGEWHEGMPDSYDHTWKCIKMRGPLDFGLTGILADFTAPLKTVSISVFALSTWNTDYVLVKADRLTEAVSVLEQNGWIFET